VNSLAAAWAFSVSVERGSADASATGSPNASSAVDGGGVSLDGRSC
jgi:hypothetical protein